MTDIQTIELTQNYGKFVVTPLERGYGQTIGNAMRRMLLSSIPGAAVVAVRVEKVLHEFAPIPGAKEDMTEFMLNLRDVAIRVNSDRPPEEDFQMLLDVKGPGRVTAADIQTPDDIEIVNPDCYLCTLSEKGSSLYAELFVSWGTGYTPPERQENYRGRIGVMPMGSQFTPVRKVNYVVEATRVGQRTDYDRLTLEVWTNGSVSPDVAIKQAASFLDNFVRLFFELGKGSMDVTMGALEEISDEDLSVPDIRVEEMDFSQRTLNCLKRAEIETLRDLVRKTEDDLECIPGFGKKAMEEVLQKLDERGLSLRSGAAVVRSPLEGETF
ncbi:MAG: DNA-directed RNA polymerase subunit alpha [Armatimonadota bacterium]